MGEHSRLSPSSASRWINCPGSARLDLPDDSNEAADHGTMLHAIAASILQGGLLSWVCTPEDQELIDAYVDYVRGIPGRHHYEQRIISEIEPEFGGTVDCVAVMENTLHVVDFKSGHGRVDTEDNKQLKSYLCLARERFGPRLWYVGHIVQPRLGAPTSQEFTWKELDEHERLVWAAAKDGTLKAGSWCKFCPLALACRTRQDYDRAKVVEAFDDHPDVAWCDEVIAIAEVMAKRKDAAEARLIELAKQGVEIPGRRLAQSFGDRTWTDETHARLVLGLSESEFFKTTPKSPAVVETIVREKLGGARGTGVQARNMVNEFTERKRLGPCLVTNNSSLPPWRPSTPEDFDDAY